MNNRKQTKRALLTSVMALALCVVMLVGTTFAWFTDTAKTNVNTIKSGSLKIALEKATTFETKYYPITEDEEGNEYGGESYIVPAGWQNAKDDTLNFIKSDADGNYSVINDDSILWEPGCTFELQPIRVRNDGNLALKYEVRINGGSGDLDLLDAIKFSAHVVYGYEDAIFEDIMSTGTICWGNLKEKDDAATIYITAHMDENAGNTYQNKTLSDIAITVVATQHTYEFDSTTDQYDKNATYPDVAFSAVSSSAELADAITNAKDADGNTASKVSVDLATAGTYTLPAVTNKELTITGDEDTVIDMTQSGIIGAQNTNLDLMLDGVSVKFANDANYKGITHSKKVTYKDCTITGKQFLYADEVEFINCVFENSDDYCVWTYSSPNVTFTNCEFYTGGKAILVYNEKTNENFTATIKVDGCEFYDDGTLTEEDGSDLQKAAIETGSNADNTATSNRYIIDMKNIYVEGFAGGENTNHKYWGNKNNMDEEHLIVTIR